MKHHLSGVALVALLALAAPVWAQAPATPSSPNISPGAPPAASEPQATTPARVATTPAPRPKRPVRQAHRRYRGTPSDHVANRLNAAELARNGAPAPVYRAPAYPPPYPAPVWGYPPPYPYPYPPPWGYPAPWGYPRPY